MSPCLSSLLESRLALRIIHLYKKLEIVSFVVDGNVKLTIPPNRQ